MPQAQTLDIKRNGLPKILRKKVFQAVLTPTGSIILTSTSNCKMKEGLNLLLNKLLVNWRLGKYITRLLTLNLKAFVPV